MKRKLCTLVAVLGIMLSGKPAAATVHTVTVANYVFSPNSLSFPLGDTIMWIRINGSHTSTSTSIPGSAASWNATLDSANTSFMYVPAVSGVYNYQCTPHASMGMLGTFTVTGQTNVNTVSASGWDIYPNPVFTTLYLRAPVKVTTAEIYDFNGRVLWNGKINSNNMSIDVSPMPTGFYFLHLVSEDKENFVRTIVVMH